jgi:quercetin dioxygenase-like cupin family protein
MYGAGIMKATQTVVQPRHMHPYPFTFTVLQGSIVTSDPSGKDVEYGPGSVVYRAPGEAHKTTIKAGAVVFAVMSGPMMTMPVDASGQAQHAQK